MKMFVFPRENETGSLELNQSQPLISPALDAAVVRLCAFMLAWAGGASMAIILAVAG